MGHGHPRVRESLHRQTDLATSFGAPARLEVELAELLTGLIPGLELVRLVSSGTEATIVGSAGRARVHRAGEVHQV
ncbi:MAG: glutamate-1-semialdehyde 2,1-aminomutase [Chlorobi bacterium OLB7]|nr:MAG: glutamate-1-semialdehyde 2,1-aminomutase [Chlorobi bacterium OLB7]